MIKIKTKSFHVAYSKLCWGFVLVWMRLRIRHFRSLQIGIRFRIRALMTKNWKHFTAKKIFFDKKLQMEIPRHIYGRSLQPSEENIQHFKTWGSFLPSWIRIWIRVPMQIRIQPTNINADPWDPDPATLVQTVPSWTTEPTRAGALTINQTKEATPICVLVF